MINYVLLGVFVLCSFSIVAYIVIKIYLSVIKKVMQLVPHPMLYGQGYNPQMILSNQSTAPLSKKARKSSGSGFMFLTAMILICLVAYILNLNVFSFPKANSNNQSSQKRESQHESSRPVMASFSEPIHINKSPKGVKKPVEVEPPDFEVETQESIEEVKNAETAHEEVESSPTKWFIQIGAYGVERFANDNLEKWKLKFPSEIIQVFFDHSVEKHRLLFGIYENENEATISSRELLNKFGTKGLVKEFPVEY